MALTVPNTFVAGTTAVASEVNDNFVAVKVFVDGLETDVAALEIKSPVITLAGDLTGSATLTNLGNATLTATIAANSVALGTDTTGNYVSNVTAGTGVTVTHTPGEGSSAAVAIDGTVVTLSGTQTLTNKTLTSPTITGVSPVVTLSGDVTGSATLTNLGSATITATIAADSVALGSDTTGNYVSTITAGTGITGSASSESATPTIAIDAAVVPQLGVANTFTTNQVIAASSASDLLRITQTGTGNAFVVEDEANPDSTPFVIDASGNVFAGTANNYGKANIGGTLAVHSATPLLNFVNNSNTRLAYITHDATNLSINNQIAGELRLATNNATQMRIDSAGRIGIGSTAGSDTGFSLTSNLTGAATVYGIRHFGTIQSDATTNTHVISAQPSTAAAAFTATKVNNFTAFGGTVGATSAIGTQVGYFAAASLTVATNNYAFQGSIASGTGRWNLVMDGTAPNYLLGRLGVGAAITTGAMAQITNTTAADVALTVKGAASQTGLLLDVENSAGTTLVSIDSAGYVGIGTATPYQPAGYGALTVDGTGGSIYSGRVNGTEHFRIQSTATSTTLNVIANVPLLFNTNNVERMRIDTAGQVGIGISPSAGRNLEVRKNVTGATEAFSIFAGGNIQSDVTAGSTVFAAAPAVAASVTVPLIYHFGVRGVTLGSGAAATTVGGFVVSSGMTQGTNNRGFWGALADAANTYNLYMSGTASNYMAGRLGVGAALTTGAMALITNTTAADKALVVKGAASQTGNLQDWQDSAGTVLAKIDASGNLTANTISTPVAAVTTPITAATHTVGTADTFVVYNTTATCTVTLPAPASFTGRVLYLKTIANFSINSASSNVKPITSNTAGTAILDPVTTPFATLVSDGTNWVIMSTK